jgi:hypothetical protein
LWLVVAVVLEVMELEHLALVVVAAVLEDYLQDYLF